MPIEIIEEIFPKRVLTVQQFGIVEPQQGDMLNLNTRAIIKILNNVVRISSNSKVRHNNNKRTIISSGFLKKRHRK